MIHDLKPYPAMKDSGVPWLGQVPEHWDFERGKNLFRKMDRPVEDKAEVVTCFRDGTVTLRKNRRLRGFTEALKEIGYQGVQRGDLVIHAMDAFAGAIGVSDSDGKGTPVYAVCQPLDNANPHFYAYILREMSRNEWILALSKGIRERSTDFRFDTFGSQVLPLPSPDEQAAIVHFLDHADRRIRRTIAAKQRLIKLLQEQKQVIIHQAVTRGLDPDVNLKPSGVGWLGEVPETWEVKRAKYYFYEVDQRSEKGIEEMLSVSHLTGVTPRSEKNVTMFKSETNVGQKICQPNDIVVNILWAWMGALGISKYHGIVSPAYGIYRQRAELFESDYLDNLLRTKGYIEEYGRRSKGVTSSRARMYTDDFFDIPYPCPPINEQKAIVQYVEKETRKTSDAISRTQQEVALLREYRTRLIADVITGKLDVREAVAGLPELDAEPLPADLELEDGDLEGEDAEAEADAGETVEA